MTIIYLSDGGDAGGLATFAEVTPAFRGVATASGGSVTVSNTVSRTGPSSFLCTTPTAGGRANLDLYGTLGQTRRISFGLRVDRYPASGNRVVLFLPYNDATFQDAGPVYLRDDGTLQLGFSGPISTDAIAVDTWVRVCVTWVITSTTDNDARLYVDGDLWCSTTDVTLATATPTLLLLGIAATAGTPAGLQVWIDDIYIDDDSSLDDTGDVQVTAKRPAGLGTNQFAVGIGSGTNRWDRVSERPVSTSNGWSNTANNNPVLETYAIEGVSAGDVDLTGATILGRRAWVYAAASSAGTGQIVDNGTETAISLVTTARTFAVVSTSGSYPSATDQIGIRAMDGTPNTHLYDCGVLIAALVPVENVLVDWTPAGGVTFAGTATVERIAVYTVTPSGGITLSGAATVALVWVVAPAGGVTFAGTGSGSYSAVYTVTPDGGVAFGGTAAHELTSGTQEFTHTPTGGIALAGVAVLSQLWSHAPTGGVAFAGAAETARIAVYTVQPSGGLDLAGTASLARLWAITGTSGVTFAGAATLNQTWTHAPSGGVAFAGSAPVSTAGEFIYQPSGGVTFAGAGGSSSVRAITPSDGIAFDGAATLARVHAYLASDGLALGGGADLASVRVVSPDGGIVLDGGGLGVFVPLQLVFLSSVTGGDRAAVGVAGSDTSAVAVAGGTAVAVGVIGGDGGGAAVAGDDRAAVSVRGGDSRP